MSVTGYIFSSKQSPGFQSNTSHKCHIWQRPLNMSESTQPAAPSSTSPTNAGAVAAPSAAGAVTTAAGGQPASLVAEATPEIFNALRNLIMTQTGGPVSNDRVSNLLLANMTTLVSQGKLTQKQILLVSSYAISCCLSVLTCSLRYRGLMSVLPCKTSLYDCRSSSKTTLIRPEIPLELHPYPLLLQTHSRFIHP